MPTFTDTVIITGNVSDNVLVASVRLSYNTGGGWVDVTMLDDGVSGDGAAGDGVYGAAIPAQPTDTIVDYYLVALDDIAAQSTDPPFAPALTHVYVVGYVPPALFINEFMADNDTVIEDPDAPLEYDDWLEIYNAEPFMIDLGGMYLTDDLTFPRKFLVPAGTMIPAGGYLLFWADNQAPQGPAHLNFKLGASGEQIGLYDADARGNVPIDTLTFGPQQTDVSQGRCPDASSNWQFFNPGTPGAMNAPCGAEVQACCLAGGVCDDLDSIICGNSGGLAQGSGSSCTTTTCPECVADEDCDDEIICTIDRCDMITNMCGHTTFDSVCSDSVFCNGAEVCDLSAGCTSGAPPCQSPEDCIEESDVCMSDAACVDVADCDDSNECTIDSCNTATSTCDHTPKDCSDPDPCTIDTCNSGTGACEHTPINCGAGQTCIAGQCEVDCVDASTCGDGVSCTIDTCETVQGQDICVHTADDSVCDTGLFCAAQRCDAQLGCVFDHECVSSDGNPCPDAASCDDVTDTCGGCVAPSVTASGCRYLAVTAGDNGAAPMAFLVEGDCNDHGVLCVSQYVWTVCKQGVNDGLDCVNDGDCPKSCEIGDRQGQVCSSELDCPPLNIGSRCQGGCTGMRFDTTPFYKTASDWGTTQVTRVQIRPSSTYHVYAECDFGGTPVRSAGAKATTWVWGDANGDDRANAIDITLTVDSVKEVVSSATFEGTNFWPCDVNEKVNVTDIASVVDAVKSLPFTCPGVCP